MLLGAWVVGFRVVRGMGPRASVEDCLCHWLCKDSIQVCRFRSGLQFGGLQAASVPAMIPDTLKSPNPKVQIPGIPKENPFS